MDEPNYFGELLRLLHIEELLRLQRRCEMQNKLRLAEILGDEVIEREMIEKAEREQTRLQDFFIAKYQGHLSAE